MESKARRLASGKLLRVYRRNGNLNLNISVRICILAASLAPAVLSFAAPLRQSTGGFPNGELIYRWLSLICHQLPSRSFWILGFPCGLCSRCLLGYFGVALAALFISRPAKYSKRILLGSALLLPAILDISIQNAAGYQSPNLTRAFTGLLGGIGFFTLCFPLRFEKSLISHRRLLMKSSSLTGRLAAMAILAFFIFGGTNAFAREVVLAESTLVPVQTKERISSKDMRAGEQVILSVERDIKIDGATVIESGAPVVAVVSDRKGAGMAGISGHITVNVEYTTAVDKTVIPLKGSFNTKGESEIGGTVAVGTILCPLAFLNRGKEGIVPAGAVIRTLTLSDKTVKVSDK